MATGWLNAIAENQFYIGCAKQTAWGTAVVPTCFHRWLDGTSADPMPGYNEDRDGDDGEVGFAWKTGQYWAIVVVERVRPQTIGYCLEAALRSGSDTLTAPTFGASTISATVNAGDTTFSTATNLGAAGQLGMNFEPGYNSAKYEVVNVDLSTKTGVGPFTYTLFGGTKFVMGHTSGITITSASTHTFNPKVAPFDPYSYEFGWGATSFGLSAALRTVNAVCKQVRISGAKGQALTVQHTWWASSAQKQAALATVLYENTNAVGRAGSPFKWYDGTVYKINGGTTLNAATMDSFDLVFDNDIAWDDLQSELLTAPYFIPGNYNVGGSIGYVFTDFSQYSDALFGGTAFATSATDSALIGRESAEVKFTLDAVNSLDITVPNIYYQGPKLAPRRSGRGLHQQLQFSSIRPTPDMTPTTNVTYVLTNSLATAY